MATSNYSCAIDTNSFLGSISGGIDNITELHGSKSQITNINGYRDVSSYKRGSIFGYSKLKALIIKAGIDVDAILDMRSSLKFAIQSFIDLNGEINLDAVYNFAISANINEDFIISLVKKVKTEIAGDIDLTSWDNTILKNIDQLLLSELDDLTLSEIDRREGVNFILTKQFAVNQTNDIDCVLDLYLYYFARLYDYDNITLAEMDNFTLGELDKGIVVEVVMEAGSFSTTILSDNETDLYWVNP